MKKPTASSLLSIWKSLILCVALFFLLLPASARALTAPTLADYNESDFTDSGVNDETTGSISWQTGDIIIVFGATADNAITLGTPTATGLSFALVDSTSGGSTARTYLWSATAGSNGSSAVAAVGSHGSANDRKGISVFVYRGSDGLGTKNKITGLTDTYVMNLSRASDNSKVAALLADWNAEPDVAVTAVPLAGSTEREASESSGDYSAFVFDWGDQGTSGSADYGFTDHDTGDKMSGIVVEVRGSAAAPAAGRIMRLFEGFRIKLISGRIIVNQMQ